MLRPVSVYELVTPPAEEPVSLAEAKLAAHIDGSDHDDLVTALIAAAREHVELETRRCLVTQTWRLTLDDWPGTGRDDWWDGCREAPITQLDAAWVEIQRSPVAAITSVVVKDEDGTPTTWAATNYYLGKRPGGHGRLVRKSGAVWPSIGIRDAGAVEITFTAGYGAASAVPYALRHAIKTLIKCWFDDHCEGNERSMPNGLAAILAKHRVLR